MSLSLEVYALLDPPPGHVCYGLANSGKPVTGWCWEEGQAPSSLFAFIAGVLQGVSILGRDTGTTSGTFVKCGDWSIGQDDIGLYVVDHGMVDRFENWAGVMTYLSAPMHSKDPYGQPPP